MTVVLDPGKHTLSYTDATNGESGTVPYIVNADGTYALQDPSGNLTLAYEVPGDAVVIAATALGPQKNSPALITALSSGPITHATFAARTYNYIQFRTSAGGVELGSVDIDPSGSRSISSYTPYTATMRRESPFQLRHASAESDVLDPTGTFMRIGDLSGNGSDADMFGVANGVFAIDSPEGTIYASPQAILPTFNSANSGTYKALYYEKKNVTVGKSGVETSNPTLSSATVALDQDANFTVTDATHHTLLTGTLIPVANATYLYGSSAKLGSACPGLFTVRTTTLASQQDVFVTFTGKSMLFASFTAALPLNGGSPYSYLYGVGMRQ